MNTSDLQSILNIKFREPVANLVARSNPFLAAIPKVAVAGGDNVRVRAKSASNHNAGPIADGATVTVGSPSTTHVAGLIPWATYKADFRVDARTMAELANQPGDIGRILGVEIENAAIDLADRIGADMWKGSVTNGLVGVKDIINDTGTYANIDRSTVTNWAGIVIDAEDAEISTALLESAEQAYFTANKTGMRDHAGNFTGMLTPALLTKYSALLENIDLSSLSTAHFVNRANASGFLGHSKVGWMGIPFMRDPDVDVTGDTISTGRLYLMDLDHIKLAILDPFNKEAQRKKAMVETYGIEAAPVLEGGINTEIVILGTAGEFVAGYVRVYLQMASSNPKKAGVCIKNIAAD